MNFRKIYILSEFRKKNYAIMRTLPFITIDLSNRVVEKLFKTTGTPIWFSLTYLRSPVFVLGLTPVNRSFYKFFQKKDQNC